MGNAGVTAALILVAVAVLMQAGAMLGIFLATRRIAEQVVTVRSEIKQRIDPVAQSVQEIAQNSREPIRTIMGNLAEISNILRNRAANADQVAADLLDRSRSQVDRVDRMVTDLVDRVENTAEVLQVGVLTPIREISALAKGVRSGLDFLFSHRRVTRVSEATQDEQLFI